MNFNDVILVSVFVGDKRWIVVTATSHDDAGQRNVDGRIVAAHLRRRAPVSATVERRGPSANRLRRHLDADVVRLPRHPAGNGTTELLPEPPAHGAVDEEVERVAKQDDKVEEEVEQIARVLGDDGDVGGVLNDHNAHADSEREFDKQEQCHDYDQHQRRRVALLLQTKQTSTYHR